MSDLATFTPRPMPGLTPLQGQLVRLEPFDAGQHGEGLFAAIGGEANASLWEWMPVGPFRTADSLTSFLAAMHNNQERWRTMVIRSERTGEILGSATYMRIREAHGSAEIGCVAFGPKLRRTAEASEALYLMAAHVFALGYRRYEWKCNNENVASKRAAERFGFVFEGIFRNDMVTKGRSRDTAWYSITDAEWPRLDAAMSRWLAPSNFAPDGAQLRTLESLRNA
jgi:RimJ/RimL family protein N-acetyltransferase